MKTEVFLDVDSVATALKTISNDTNHLAQTPLDAAFASQKYALPKESHDDAIC